MLDIELHTRLKMEAAKQRLSIGKLIEKIFNRATFDLCDYPRREVDEWTARQQKALDAGRTEGRNT